MTDDSTTSRTALARLLGQLVLIAAASVAVLVVAAGVIGRRLVFDSAFMCGPQVSEGTMIAPASWRGLLWCGGSADDVSGVWVVALIAPPLACGLAALVLWARTRRVRLVALVLVLMMAIPVALLVVVRVLPADCTDGQLSRAGAAGCERDIESR